MAALPDFTNEFGANAPFVADLFARWRENPATVAEDWRDYFGRIGPANDHAVPNGAAAPPRTAPLATPPDAPKVVAREASDDDAEPIRGVAARIVRNMEESLGIPTATSVRTIPVKLLEENRNVLNRHLAVAGRGKASYTHLVAFAIVRAFREMPRLNAAFVQADGHPARVRHDAINLGIAIDIEGKEGARSLVVPNIKDAGALDYDRFVRAYNEIVERARAGKLTPEDFQGTTVTLTNPGTLGTIASVPRLMAGQGVIIATGAIAYPPEFQAAPPETLSQLGISRVLTVTSTYDHRIIQGAESGLLLQRIDALLQAQGGFYEDVFNAVDCPHAPFVRAKDRAAGMLGGAAAAAEAIEKQAHVLELIRAYRERGLLIADLDPLEFKPACPPELDIATYGLGIWDLDRTFMTGGLGGKPMATLREILEILLDTYARRIGVESMHIADPTERAWVQQRIEPTRNLAPFTLAEQRRILAKLNAAEGFERFLHTRFLGQKRFSLEGAETLIPMLDELLNRAVDRGIRHVVMGMAHRGRLNVLVNTFNKSYERIFSEFEGAGDPASSHGSGDVKYHLGAEGEHVTPQGKTLPMTLASNPSHLEAVNAVVEGMARAMQDHDSGGGAETILPVLIHGDAAFAGQGIVAETLNMSRLAGYRTGGTVHIIVNNQIGYTAGPDETRSTRYCTDMAKSVGALILHVNGDYPESVLRAIRVAFDYREKFAADAVVDLVCYRRWGHNETDEPAYTQPLLYKKIQAQPSVRERYGRLLVARKQMTESEREESVEDYTRELKAALDSFRAQPSPAARAPQDARSDFDRDCDDGESPDTGVPADIIERCIAVATRPPEGFTVHPNLARQLARRVEMARGAQPLDWGSTEAVALGSLLIEGTRVRLAGQDTGRGTFSQRHAIIVDQERGTPWIPLAHLGEGQARIEVINSLLSEEAAVGFEFGYAVTAPEALVLWEAQFGDFCNGAQVQIDQFLAASESKWGQTCGVVLLLPHGYDGQGPEHSSARLERFLQLCAGGNMSVINCSTAAQYFHALRRQGRAPVKRPLVVMTPKSLLKKREAASEVEDLMEGRFEMVLPDLSVDARSARRVLLCSGKVFYDLEAFRAENKIGDVAVIRVEQLHPLPRRALVAALAGNARQDVTWVQEEPRNMGAWTYMEPRLAALGLRPAYVGRAAAASPASGSLLMHQGEQDAIVRRAFA